jgi:hypothetical protein
VSVASAFELLAECDLATGASFDHCASHHLLVALGASGKCLIRAS